MKIKRILFPTDFSPCSNAALETALFQARTYDAELHMLHVVIPGVDDLLDSFPEPEVISDKLRKVAEVRMKETLAQHGEEPFKIVEAVRAGTSAIDVIEKYVEEHLIDMVVMGTHGRKGLKHFLIGSVAEKLVRTAACSVMTVRAGENHRPLKSVDRILAPVDFSEFSEAVLLTAMDIAQKQNAELFLLHVVEDHFRSGGMDAVWTGVNAPLNHYREIREKQLTEFAAKASDAGVAAHTRLANGRSHVEIAQYAKEIKADLLVMGTHGFSGLEHMWLGSTTERVVRVCDAPVFTIKIHEE